jgi:molybdopterin/thiamine biosynthesis adenylyltransferase
MLRTFKPESITIYDRDQLEARNLDRQLFNPKDVGMNKATALARFHQRLADELGTYVQAEEDWFTKDSRVSRNPGTILLSCADNHVARCAVMDAAVEAGIPAVIGGNEYFDSEAYIFLPEWEGGAFDPRTQYPNMRTDTRGSPLHCQEAQEYEPQLALANFDCAAKVLKLCWILQQWNGEGILLRHMMTSLYENSQKRFIPANERPRNTAPAAA